MAQISLAWLLHRSPVMLPIPGTGLVHINSEAAAENCSTDAQNLAALIDNHVHHGNELGIDVRRVTWRRRRGGRVCRQRRKATIAALRIDPATTRLRWWLAGSEVAIVVLVAGGMGLDCKPN